MGILTSFILKSIAERDRKERQKKEDERFKSIFEPTYRPSETNTVQGEPVEVGAGEEYSFLRPDNQQGRLSYGTNRLLPGPIARGVEKKSPTLGELDPERTASLLELPASERINFMFDLREAQKKLKARKLGRVGEGADIIDEETGKIIYKNPKDFNRKKNVDRVVGEDGFYYDVIEDPSSGKTEYVKSDVKARPLAGQMGLGFKQQQTILKRIAAITNMNQKLGERATAVGAGQAKDAEGFVIDPNKDAGKSIIKNLEDQIYDNELLLEDLNAQIGGTFQAREPNRQSPATQQAGERENVESTRVVNGKTYVKINGEWYEK